MSDEVVVTLDGAVLEIAINRPDKRNALNTAMYAAMAEAILRADRDDAVRAVLIYGRGGSFTAGNDLANFLTRGDGPSPALGFIEAIALAEKPVVAAVEGHAVGVGTTMLFHCDFVYAAPSARFRMPFVDLGLVPEAASSYTVPARVGMARASQWLLLGDGFDAEEAFKAGLVNAVLPPEALLGVARDTAARLAAKPPVALAATRRLIRGDRTEIRAAMAREWGAFASALKSDEAQAILFALVNKAKSAA